MPDCSGDYVAPHTHPDRYCQCRSTRTEMCTAPCLIPSGGAFPSASCLYTRSAPHCLHAWFHSRMGGVTNSSIVIPPVHDCSTDAGGCLQICAFAYYSAPLYYITEKALGVHHKPFYIRVPCRYPVGEHQSPTHTPWCCITITVCQHAVTNLVQRFSSWQLHQALVDTQVALTLPLSSGVR